MLTVEVVTMAITWNDAAVERSSFEAADLVVLTADKYDLAADYRATYDQDAVDAWHDNLSNRQPTVLYTATEIKRYAAMHAELFGTKAAS